MSRAILLDAAGRVMALASGLLLVQPIMGPVRGPLWALGMALVVMGIGLATWSVGLWVSGADEQPMNRKIG